MIRRLEEKLKSVKCRAGSALVLVIVITVMLAVVGVMFVMMARVDSIATSAISDNSQLAAAVDTVVERINTVLVDDLFGSDANMLNGPGDSTNLSVGDEDEYWDYPGPDDPWLANLEPYEFGPGDYRWRHISDIYEVMWGYAWDVSAHIVQPTDANDADADGDGVTDSLFVQLPISSSKGRPIFAAVRIIDNCGMININTAYRDPTGAAGDWDGSLLTHVNLDTDMIHNDYQDGSYYGFMADGDDLAGLTTAQLHGERCGGVLVQDPIYHDEVATRLLNPVVDYVPFDIGDELEFRNRFFLFSPVVTRSGMVWPVTFNPGPSNVGKQIPYAPDEDIADWFEKVTSPEIDPCDRICNRRHISTTYSFDRIVRPYGETPLPGDMLDAFELDTFRQRKFGIRLPPNIPDMEQYIRQLAGAIYRGLPGDTEIAGRFGQDYTREKLSWQFAVNLIDYQDNDGLDPCNPDDDDPTYYRATLGDGSEVEFWGVENVECIKHDTIFISQVAYVNFAGAGLIPPGDYFAIELLNPNTAVKDLTLNDYRIAVESFGNISLSSILGNTFPSNDVVVLTNDETNATTIFAGSILNDPTKIFEVTGLSFNPNDEIVVYKEDWPSGSGADMPVDRIEIPQTVVDPDGLIHAAERNETLGPIADNLLWTELWSDTGELGTVTGLTESDPNVQLVVTNEALRTIGEIENVLAVGYSDPNDDTDDNCHTLIGSIEESYNQPSPSDMGSYGRINLADPNYWGLLDFLTCFDPSNDGVDNNGDGQTDEETELAIAGRININTAPWFVIKHLPWVGLTNTGADTDNLAQAIVAWRDGLNLSNIGGPNYGAGRYLATGITGISEEPGFTNIAQLLQVINMGMTAPEFDIRKYLDGVNTGAAGISPDYSVDVVDDDFEERDIIFQRISNLVTVRSDVFTAYILVRIGHSGPQKRMIAIFDRSNVYLPTDRPRLVALHPVPDPR